MTPTQNSPLSDLRLLYIIIGSLTLLRLVVLFVTPLNLGPDEAQYWSWSKDLAFGYFSKPPVIAWLIASTTSLFGDSEAVIRMSSPLIHAATSFVLFILAKDLYNNKTAFWTALTFATLPAVFFSSSLITTDMPLLFFWSVALLSFHRTLQLKDLKWAALTGLMIGLGFMSKYAMIYFVLCAAIYLASTRSTWWFFRSKQALVMLALMTLVLIPNILWNVSSGFATFTHTAANANWQGDMFNFDKMFDFIGGQFGVFGPILFLALVWGAIDTIRKWKTLDAAERGSHRFLLTFCLPILIIAITQSFLSRANANWAASAYAAATVFTVAWVLRQKLRWLVPTSIAVHTALGLFLYTLITIPGTIEATGMSNSFKRVRAWDQIGQHVLTTSTEGAFTSIMADDRLITAELLYYVRARFDDVVYWDADLHKTHHYELSIPIRPSAGQKVLFVSKAGDPKGIFEHFETSEYLETVTVTTGIDKSRTVHLYALTNYKGRSEFGDHE